jgi:hypothetical protein
MQSLTKNIPNKTTEKTIVKARIRKGLSAPIKNIGGFINSL